jgi:hypothetical protein
MSENWGAGQRGSADHMSWDNGFVKSLYAGMMEE